MRRLPLALLPLLLLLLLLLLPLLLPLLLSLEGDKKRVSGPIVVKAQNGKMSIMHGKWPSEVSMSTDVGKPKDT